VTGQLVDPNGFTAE